MALRCLKSYDSTHLSLLSPPSRVLTLSGQHPPPKPQRLYTTVRFEWWLTPQLHILDNLKTTFPSSVNRKVATQHDQKEDLLAGLGSYYMPFKKLWVGDSEKSDTNLGVPKLQLQGINYRIPGLADTRGSCYRK